MSTIETSIEILASPQKVWKCLTHSACLEKWWGKGVSLDPVVGGKFAEPWNDSSGDHLATGAVTDCKPLTSIKFTWHEDSWPADTETSVSIRLEDDGGTCNIFVSHVGWDVFSEGERVNKVSSFSAGWNHVLSELKKFSENLDE